ncbi:cytochrome P450 [Pisolithus marmoratus]|nr:cytochrome P450 [Pisolithus marmoratus]
MASDAFVYFSSTLCFVGLLYVWRIRTRRGGLPLPPGPRGLPLIGNVFDVNIAEPWLTYEEWGKQYGGIVHAKLLGKDLIILNSERIARVLLEQRSTIYSDRPHIPTNKLFGMDFNTGLLPYGSEWKLHRRMFRVALNKRAAATYKSLEMRKVHQLLRNLVSSPEEYSKHAYTLSAAIIMAVTYGYDVAPQNDPFVSKLVQLLSLFLDALTPERAALIGAIPLLAYIPSWFPGGRYKQRAKECRILARDILDEPVNYVKECIDAGTATKSLVYDLIQGPFGSGEGHEDAVKAVAATVFLARLTSDQGGAETTHATVLVFLLAMVLYPEVQTKAQEEIDRVVGTDRLPNFDDRPNLPYVEAVFLETLRWHPVSPMGLPHMTTTSDVFDGMYIPKGTAMAHDERHFTEPSIFSPERHLRPTGDLGKDIAVSPYSFGRRYCPGRYVADMSVWATIVSVLATLRIEKAKDHCGNVIDVVPEFTGGLSSSPKPFSCAIKARSPAAEQLIHTSHVGD